MEQPPTTPPLAAVQDAWPPALWRDNHVLAAVSGGADSVALLRRLAELKSEAGGRGRLIVAHFDHRTRGPDSADDAQWVARLADRLGLEAQLGAADAPLASEQSARDARYAWLAQTAAQTGARHIATGHTADDQAETILFRLLRGSGLAGLAGIPPTRPLNSFCDLVRPLLGVTRAEVEAYLSALGQDFRRDATNATDDYARNRLRRRVLPLLRDEFGGSVDAALRRAGAQAAEAQDVIAAVAAALADESLIEQTAEQFRLLTDPLSAAAPLAAREACKLLWRRQGWPEQAMGAAEWARLLGLIRRAGPDVLNLPGGVTARREGDRVTLSARPTGPVRE